MTDATLVFDLGAGSLADKVNDLLEDKAYTYYDGSLVNTRRNEGVVPAFLIRKEKSTHLFATEAADWIALATRVCEANEGLSYTLIAAIFGRAIVTWGAEPATYDRLEKSYTEAGADFNKWIAAMADSGVGLPYAATQLAGLKPTSIFTGFPEKPAEDDKKSDGKKGKKNQKDDDGGKKSKKGSGDGQQKKKKEKQ